MSEYPKWVPVHDSHVTRKQDSADAPAAISVALFPQHHVDRKTGNVMVLAKSPEDEELAAAAAPEGDD